MPNTKKQSRYCYNCHYPLADYSKFCTKCGQRFTDGKVTIRQLLAEFFDTVFNFDNRLFRSIGALVVPSKLTSEYFKGHQQRYFRPIRLFLVAAIIHFAALGFAVFDDLEAEFSGSVDNQKKEVNRKEFVEKLRTEADTVIIDFGDAKPLSDAMDSLLHRVEKNREDSTSSFYYDFRAGKVIDFDIATRDVFRMEIDSLFEKYEIPEGAARYQVKQFLKLSQHGGSFARQLLGQLVWMFMLLLPSMAFVMKLLYIRRKHYYVEHLVYNFHMHSFLFLMMAIGFVYLGFTEDDSIFGWLFLAAMIYTYSSMYRYYKQGWFKTFIKFLIYNFSYLFLFIFFLVLTFAISALTY